MTPEEEEQMRLGKQGYDDAQQGFSDTAARKDALKKFGKSAKSFGSDNKRTPLYLGEDIPGMWRG